ncbi:MAG: protein-glutamate O-methyltransferase [Pseudomonadota bacterium]
MSTIETSRRPAPAADNAKMTPQEFERFSGLVYDLTGIVIKEHKLEMIQSRISRRVRANKMTTFGEYLAFVDSAAGASEIGELINVVTTNLTSFFRENHHFEHLKDEMLEPAAAAGVSRFRIWSSACSSGEEPYSIAMTVLDSAAARLSDLKILATDLDTNILDRASKGVYAEDRVAPIPEALRKRAFTSGPDGYAAAPTLKQHISFRQLNLLQPWPMSGPFDVIFCRNVLIYFDAETKMGVVNRMAELLRPDGALYLGHSESLLGEHPLLRSEGSTIYRRRS